MKYETLISANTADKEFKEDNNDINIMADRKNLALFSEAIDKVKDGIQIIHMDGIIIHSNKAIENMYGYTAREMIGKHFAEIYEDKNVFSKIILPAIEKMGQWAGEIRGKHKDGRIFFICLSASVIKENNIQTAIICILNDRPQRKENERILYESEQRYKKLVEFSTDIIYLLDRQCNVTFMNDVGYRVLETEPEELIGKKWVEWIHPDDRENTSKKLTEMIENQIDLFHHESRFLSKNGDITNFIHNIRIIQNEKGEFIGTQGIARDVTDIKEAGQIILENERLALASKTKSEFIAIMSHELRTPLNAVIGFSELIIANGEISEKQSHYLSIIIRSSKHLLDLINNILDLSSIEAGKIELCIEEVSIQDILNETLMLIKENRKKHNIDLKIELDPGLIIIETDRMRLIQILFNLLSNAVKFSKRESGKITIIAKREGNAATFSVTDNGIGIKEEDISRLFKEFEQLDSGISRKYGGTGLGLAISKRMVELLGGRIWAESIIGMGSTFSFTIPLKKNPE